MNLWDPLISGNDFAKRQPLVAEFKPHNFHSLEQFLIGALYRCILILTTAGDIFVRVVLTTGFGA